MSPRGKIWSIGLAITIGLAVVLGREAESRELSVPVALLSLSISALAAEGPTLLAHVRAKPRPVPPAGARPADGVVEIIPVSGVEGEVNPRSPRFRRFLGRPGIPAGPSEREELSTTNPALLGRVALISVFVGRDGVGWTSDEIAGAHESLARAGRWIEREASRHGVPVNIGLAETYFQDQDDEVDPIELAFVAEAEDVGPMEAHASTKAIVSASRAAARSGFVDVVDWLGRINPRVEADARAWLFHVRRAGRSLAIPASECDVSGVGLALCFSREASFPEPLVGPGRVDPATVAHELLHLFGASDKYGVAIRSFPEGSVTSREIMRLDHESLSRMTIDPLTASEIGWGDTAPRISSTKNARR